jgi:type 1 glutamine amidotransferase
MKHIICQFIKMISPTILGVLLLMAQSSAQDLKVLIIDGQNNHSVWPKSTVMMKNYLEETGLYKVEIGRTAYTWNGEKWLDEFPLKGFEPTIKPEPTPDPDFGPDFSSYDVVISNFGWRAAAWPAKTQKSLEKFVSKGGGLVIIHAASNAWPEWKEFNKMIGLGGWGDRDETHGPYVYYNDKGELIRDTSPGPGGSHGPQHEFQIVIRDGSHPITQGMPSKWLHVQDELYDRLRGPAKKMEVLATTYSDPKYKGTGRHEPMIVTIAYGKGRVFHTPMGHEDYSLECVGFIETFRRGVEWAATGAVMNQTIPDDFPTADKTSRRSFSSNH